MSKDGFTVENAIWVKAQLPPWWLVLIEGILLILIGIFLLVSPYQTVAAIVWVLGLYWLIRGIIDLVSLIWDRSFWGWKIFAGILGIVAGWIVLQHPLGSASVIGNVFIWMLGLIGIFIGISSLIRGFQGAGFGTIVLGGIEIVLGLLLLVNSSTFASWLPWVMAFFAILGGIGALIGAFQIRSAEKRLDDFIES
jgi:uncharacterized membrane protein HdeD (DUF308 family)